MKPCRSAPAPACRAPTASRCCATPTATASPRSRTVFLKDLNSPFGMALVGNDSLRREHRRGVRFPYKDGADADHRRRREGRRPAGGPLNHHWTKNIIASPDGTQLYATVGSNSNVGENGLDEEEGRAAICEIDLATGAVARLRHRACAIRTAWRGSRRRGALGPWSTSATSSATISCPTT